jgi:DNA-binding response OmpR family regulator
MNENNLALVIEDDEDIAEIFNQSLVSSGFTVEVIYDGAVAQKRLMEVIPHVVVLDIHLPNVSGEVLLDQIRADQRLFETIVLVTTADTLMAEAENEKADFVLVKPISFIQLRDLAARMRDYGHGKTGTLGASRIIRGGYKPKP